MHVVRCLAAQLFYSRAAAVRARRRVVSSVALASNRVHCDSLTVDGVKPALIYVRWPRARKIYRYIHNHSESSTKPYLAR